VEHVDLTGAQVLEAEERPCRAVLRRLAQPTVGAGLLALAFALIGLLTTLLRAVDTTVFRPDDAWLVALVLLASLPIALVRRWPLATLAVVMAAVVAQALAGYAPVGVGVWAAGLALFVTAAFGSGRDLVLGALIAAAGLVALYVGVRGAIDWANMAISWAAFSFTWTIAVIVRLYRAVAARAQSRAELFAADREARAREAVANERVRLARELHDSVGHALNVIVLHAGGAQRVVDTKPALAREALDNIETAGRQALGDIERMLGILRGQGEEERFSAQAGLGQLDALIERVREAGLPVELRVAGTPLTLPTSLDLSAYRIVQEALTNTLKHAGNAHSVVALTWAEGRLEIEVVDDGRGAAAPPSAGGGRGLVGIRERVLLFGGELLVGPRSEGGFGVWARLPYGTMAPAPARPAPARPAPARPAPDAAAGAARPVGDEGAAAVPARTHDDVTHGGDETT
jgi:signal transduction histidine kinase